MTKDEWMVHDVIAKRKGTKGGYEYNNADKWEDDARGMSF